MMKKIGLTFIYILCCTILFAQSEEKKRWHLLDPDSSTAVGIAEPQGCPVGSGQQVIVAVIDGGTDPEHPDLRANIWTNEKEIAGNGLDDDGNGYADDIHGWNFIGGKNGNVDHDNLELTRMYKMGKKGIPAGYDWKEISSTYKKEKKSAEKDAKNVIKLRDAFRKMKSDIGKDSLTAADVKGYKMKGARMGLIKNSVANAMEKGMSFSFLMNSLEQGGHELENQLKYHYNTEYDSRAVVGDDINNLTERNYGNNDVKGPEASHGTHVAGIIGALKNNEGAEGVAGNVRIMVVRVVPDGDERDKDVANGIRYAVDNGAKVINMSFGKGYSPGRKVVEEAIQYAASKDVVLVHGAGNESADNNNTPNFPNGLTPAGNNRSNWIEVGANDPDGGAAAYSNYGSKAVDVFAPGTQIYSTLPDSTYGFETGTSMASPVVAGVAALIRSCYPQLTAAQVKEVIVRSAEKRSELTATPGNPGMKVPFSNLSVSGGIVNAKKALRIAGTM